MGTGRDGRDIGYGVPALCDHPGCDAEIDRGLSHVCGMINTDGEDRGCGLHFCAVHLGYSPRFGQLCVRCYPRRRPPIERKPDVAEWMRHKLADPSWEQWRQENPEAVAAMQLEMSVTPSCGCIFCDLDLEPVDGVHTGPAGQAIKCEVVP
ncbi:hypothetical protein [Bradyrhizobium phage BDU-MI-1]|nr:hypothetical protein [Bradyrhizobium phage BDU-MI-1]